MPVSYFEASHGVSHPHFFLWRGIMNNKTPQELYTRVIRYVMYLKWHLYSQAPDCHELKPAGSATFCTREKTDADALLGSAPQPKAPSHLLQTQRLGAELSEKQWHQTHELPFTSALATPQEQAVPITNPHSTAAPPRAATTPAEVRSLGTAQNSPSGHHQGDLSKKYRCSSYFYSWFETREVRSTKASAPRAAGALGLLHLPLASQSY